MLKNKLVLATLSIVLGITVLSLVHPVSAFAQCTPNLFFLGYKDFAYEAKFAPGQTFTVTWNLQNTGTCPWNENFGLVLIRGERMGISTPLIPVPAIAPGEHTDLPVTFVAPQSAGIHESVWRLSQPNVPQTYGDELPVRIQVVGPLTATTPIPSITPAGTTPNTLANSTPSIITTASPTAVVTATITPTIQATSTISATVNQTATLVAPVSATATANPQATAAPTTATRIPTTVTPTNVQPTATAILPTATSESLIPTVTPIPAATNQATELGTTLPNFVTDNLLWIVIALAGVLVLIFVLIYWLRRPPDSKKGETLPPPLPSSPGGHAAPKRAYLTSPALNEPFELRDPTLIGRNKDMTLPIAETATGAATVSPEHARFTQRNNRWVIQDGVEANRPSKAGIFVNNKRTRVNYLRDGDKIRLGDLEFVFHDRPTTAQSTRGGLP